MGISYSSLSSFEMENRKATLLATNRALSVDLLVVTEENCDGGLVWEGRKEKENQLSIIKMLPMFPAWFLQSQKHGLSPAAVLLGLGRNNTITTSK